MKKGDRKAPSGAWTPDPRGSQWTFGWTSSCPRLSVAQARAFTRRRARLLARCRRLGARRLAGGWSKLFSGELSPGCAVCAAGGWSYLESNQLCGRGCFYCPRPQDRLSEPYDKILGLSFRSPSAYAAALQAAGHGGVGLSGGEPLLAMGRTLALVRALRAALGPRARLWVYTSGAGADERRLRTLRAAGVDELRVNVSADGYRLDAVRRAARVFPVVAVEIPAVPEDERRVRALLPRIVRAGARHLVLHQLTCTPHNDAELRARGYRVTDNGPFVSPSVVESELAALGILREALARRLPLSVNYCSFIFKNRYHALARRLRLARLLRRGKDPFRAPSPAGWLRRLEVAGTPSGLSALLRRLPSGSARRERTRLLLRPEALAHPALGTKPVVVRYSEYSFEGLDRKGGRLRVALGAGRRARFLEREERSFVLQGVRERAAFSALLRRGAGSPLRARFEGYEALPSALHAL
ncbi:MAG: radical SAM protein [Elusimicrobiota bacterium]